VTMCQNLSDQLSVYKSSLDQLYVYESDPDQWTI
jgi:hypothetical protein